MWANQSLSLSVLAVWSSQDLSHFQALELFEGILKLFHGNRTVPRDINLMKKIRYYFLVIVIHVKWFTSSSVYDLRRFLCVDGAVHLGPHIRQMEV
mmetsp:Transcript_51233/g.106996  ORF Transcript_51233/g.106996 Transcript_51233/m.106996 type:complete len:96 (+) Transcript_51233:245-532(+)